MYNVPKQIMLKSAPDSLLVTNIKQKNCSDSLTELVNRHTPLYVKIYQKYAHSLHNIGVNMQDIMDERWFVFGMTVNKFSTDKKTKFSSWLGTQARYYFLNLLNNYKETPTDDKDLQFFLTHNAAAPLKKYVFLDYIFEILDQLKDPRIKKIYTMRYLGGKSKTSWNEIGKKLNVSSQLCINLHKKTLKMLRQKIKNKDIIDAI